MGVGGGMGWGIWGCGAGHVQRHWRGLERSGSRLGSDKARPGHGG